MVKTRLTAAFSAICLVFLLASCGSPAYFSYGKLTVTEGMVNYYRAAGKYLYLTEYKNYGASDTVVGWNSTYNGVTHAERFNSWLENRIKTRLAAAGIVESSVSSGTSEIIRSAIENLRDSAFYYTDAYQSNRAKDYETYLSPYGAAYDDMMKVLLYEYEYYYLFYSLFGTDYSGVTSNLAYADDVLDFYENYYLRIRIAAVKDETKLADAETAFAAVTSEDDFNAFVTAYNGNTLSNLFLYVYGSYPIDEIILNAVGRLQIGDKTSVTGEDADGNPVTYYLYRYHLNGEYKNSSYSEYFESFASEAAPYVYASYLDNYVKDVTVTELWSDIDPLTVRMCSDVNVIEMLEREN